MHIEFNHLRYVVAAAEHGSFRRAALAIGVRESAISRRIRDLEDNMGSALFIRHHSGVILTYAGEQFVRRAQCVINQIGYAERDVAVAGRGEDGVVRIGIFSSLASGFIADLVRRYGEINSNVRLNFVEGGPSEHVVAIRRHELDVAFLTGTPNVEGCDSTQLWSEQVYVAMSEGDALAIHDAIEWVDLRDRSFIVSETAPGPEIHDFLTKHLSDLGHSPGIQRQAVYRDTLMQLVANSNELTLTSEATIATHFPGVTYRELTGETLPFCAIWAPENDNPAFRRFLSLAKQLSYRRRHG